MPKICSGNVAFLILCIIALVISCSEREHLNPLDPKGVKKSPVLLRIETQQDRVLLTLQVSELQEFDGFQIYRTTNPDSIFAPLHYLQAGQNQFVDSTLSPGRWYHYRATLIAAGRESLPSNVVKALLGPGNIWILSRYGYSIHHMAYDLENTKQIIGTNYPPKSWAPDFSNHQIWVAYPPFGLVGHINLIGNYEDQLLGDSLQAPLLLTSAADENTLFVGDTLANCIFVVKNSAVEKRLNISVKDVREIYTAGRHLFVLYESRLGIYNFDGQLQSNIFLPEGFSGVDLNATDSLLLALATNINSAQSFILKIDTEQLQSESLPVAGMFRQIYPLPQSGQYWLIEVISQNSSQLVKLSDTGIRLLELSGFDYILDMAVNPIDSSMVIINAPPNFGYTREIQLRKATGELLNKTTVFDALKVVISE